MRSEEAGEVRRHTVRRKELLVPSTSRSTFQPGRNKRQPHAEGLQSCKLLFAAGGPFCLAHCLNDIPTGRQGAPCVGSQRGKQGAALDRWSCRLPIVWVLTRVP